MISMLRGQPLGLRQWTTKLATNPGTIGPHIPGNEKSALAALLAPIAQTYPLVPSCLCRQDLHWHIGNAVQVGFQSVEKSMHHVLQTLVLAGYDDPRQTYRSKQLDSPFLHLLETYKYHQDPAPKPQLAIPVATLERAGAYHQAA
jgi:hypothetical protein